MKKFMIVCLALVALGCGRTPDINVEEETDLLLQTDREFAAESIDKGVARAFYKYLADDATMLPSGGHAIEGRETIHDGMKDIPSDYVLDWEPVTGLVAQSGELGYTWGKFTVTSLDSAGVAQKSYGKYMNVWKKDATGRWKVLMDIGNQSPAPLEE